MPAGALLRGATSARLDDFEMGEWWGSASHILSTWEYPPVSWEGADFPLLLSSTAMDSDDISFFSAASQV